MAKPLFLILQKGAKQNRPQCHLLSLFLIEEAFDALFGSLLEFLVVDADL